MTTRNIAAAVLFILCFSRNAPSFAQQTDRPFSISPNPLIEQMLRASPDGDQIVELRGYVGPSTPDTVRVYKSLTLSHYFEIPRSAIVHSSQEGDANTGPVKLYVRGSAMIVSATRHTASAASRTRRADGLVIRGFASGHLECEWQDAIGGGRELSCNYVTDLPR